MPPKPTAALTDLAFHPEAGRLYVADGEVAVDDLATHTFLAAFEPSWTTGHIAADPTRGVVLGRDTGFRIVEMPW